MQGETERAERTSAFGGPSRPSAKHYENEVGFFESFLDPYMKYGSGYFQPGDGFEEASVRMLDRAIDSANLPGLGHRARVLDVGSGWGSVLRRLGERGIALEYHQINPSEIQRRFIRARFGQAESTHESGLESAALAEGTFDAVFVHDSFCHLTDKRGMLTKLARALTPSGRIIVQDTFFANEELFEKARAARTTKFIQDEIFGFAEIVPVDAYARDVAAAGLKLMMLEEISDHYKRTVAAWLSRLATVDGERFHMKETCLRYLRQGAACMGYTTSHYFSVLARQDASRDGLKETLRALRRSARGEGGGA